MTVIDYNDPRARRTRDLLKAALTTLMRDESLSSISVQDIARAASVNRRTFYAHFTDKSALVESSIRDCLREQLEDPVRALSTRSLSNLGALMRAVADILTSFTRPACALTAREYGPLIEAAAQGELEHLILRWLHHDGIAPRLRDVSLESMATLLSWTTFGAARRLSQCEDPTEEAELTRQFVALMSDGLLYAFDAVGV